LTAVNDRERYGSRVRTLAGGEVAMVKDVMVRLDGTSGDDVRLAAVNQIADIFESHITGLFFNVLSSIVRTGALASVKPANSWIPRNRQAILSKPRCSSG
jgi:hypothetical protein